MSKTKSHLIMVPCHSIWRQDIHTTQQGEPNLGHLPEQWLLAPFQLEGNDHLAFIKHGLKAIHELLLSWEDSIVIFSGGQTKKDAGPISEAQSYYFLLKKLISFVDEFSIAPPEFDEEIISLVGTILSRLKDDKKTVDDIFAPDNINTEEFSVDSFDNLLYSICRFEEITNNFPTKITITGFGFKEARFLKHHSKAIDFPSKNINYIAIEPHPSNYSKEQLEVYFTNLATLENKNALVLFEKDWYAQKSPLADKKHSRNPFKRVANYKILQVFKHYRSIEQNDNEFFEQFIKNKMPWSL